jgi:pimeloyl-ACP methyl ester carboxylesterase
MPFVKANGIRLHYDSAGDGEPLLLLMGITASAAAWEKHVAAWSKEYKCIMVDNRGAGQSDKPTGPCTTALMADDCAELMSLLDIAQARVAGCSMGGAIALQLALRHPGRVSSLVLLCAWARCDGRMRGVFDHLVQLKRRLLPEEFAYFIQLLIYSRSTWEDPLARQRLAAARVAAAVDPNPQPLYSLEAQAGACANHDVADQLPHIRCPAFLLGGGEDGFVSPDRLEEIAAKLPRCEVHVYPNAGHAFHWEHLDDFNTRVLRWLQSAPLPLS